MGDDFVGSLIVQAAIGRLTKTISDLDKQNRKLQKSILYLTLIMVLLTLVQVVGLIVPLLNKR